MFLAPFAALVLLGDFASVQAADAKKPNIIVIFGDDIGTWTSVPTTAA
jgi:hypothetical protein